MQFLYFKLFQEYIHFLLNSYEVLSKRRFPFGLIRNLFCSLESFFVIFVSSLSPLVLLNSEEYLKQKHTTIFRVIHGILLGIQRQPQIRINRWQITYLFNSFFLIVLIFKPFSTFLANMVRISCSQSNFVMFGCEVDVSLEESPLLDFIRSS